jgi:hypothetical protein
LNFKTLTTIRAPHQETFSSPLIVIILKSVRSL